MGFLLTLLLLFVFFACLGFLYLEGMWGNALNVINVVTAALLATNYFEPLARWMSSMMPSYSYFIDFLALWALFVVFTIILRQVTKLVSRVKVRFLKIVDRVGSGFFAAWVGWVMVCFVMFSLHTAPLARNFLFGGFRPEQRMFFGLAPDRQWLGFAQKMSLGAFSRSGGEHAFDPNGDFMIRYATRRANLEKQVQSGGGFRVR